ncbi:hypothetical protein EYC80_009728 [Monilinia laxa]|uniref:RING-type domain-containing protein n=1 Tax=Monilinia laxa TaxID=61186 RepID=A0A5N6JZ00_MONLA|nr:hypothetical protein EYC80_009728 [Monilinia laxa]
MDCTPAGDPCFAGIDEESLKLIIQLQIEDIDHSSSKGKGRVNDVSDISVAFKLQRDELEKTASFLSDKRMARSIALAVQADGGVLTETVSRDDVSETDHAMALQLYRGPRTTDTTPEHPNIAPLHTQILDKEVLQKLRILYISGVEVTGGSASVKLDGPDCDLIAGSLPESSSLAASRPAPPKTVLTKCVICRYQINFCDAARVPGPCRHEYCRACLERLFTLSMSDESLFPPRCCNESITVANVRLFLTDDVVRAFEEKKIEFETPNRIYCCSKPCSSFINPSKIVNEVATCDDCGTQTHTLCKLEAHIGDCSNDTALQEVLDLARGKGWQRCYSCWTMVELEVGCNHMKCRCGAMFCYTCGLKWKTCTCPQWYNDQLVARATELVIRRPRHRLLNRPYQAIGQEPEMDAQVAAAAHRVFGKTLHVSMLTGARSKDLTNVRLVMTYWDSTFWSVANAR